MQLIDFVLHVDRYLGAFVAQHGVWVYATPTRLWHRSHVKLSQLDEQKPVFGLDPLSSLLLRSVSEGSSLNNSR